MKLIDRYINEIGKNLPPKARPDIEKEIRSTLEDMLEDRSAGKPVDEELIVQTLREFGSPKKVAASYLPERRLIGPRLFPIFWMVTRIVLAVLGALALAGFGIALLQSGLSFGGFFEALGRSLAEFLGAAVSAFGNIVLVFALLERFVPNLNFDEKEEETWNPRDLPEVSEPDKFSMTGTIFEIVFTVAALVIFNFYPNLVGIGFLEAGKWTFLPVLSQTFFSYLPYLNTLWLLQILLDVFLMRQGGWKPLTHWLKLGLDLLGVALAYVMLKGPALVNLTAKALLDVNRNFTPETANITATITTQAVKVALLIAVIVGLAEAATGLYRLLRRRK